MDIPVDRIVLLENIEEYGTSEGWEKVAEGTRSDDDPLLDRVKALVGPSFEGLNTIYDGDSGIMALQHVPPIELKNYTINEDSLKNDKEINGENMDTDEQPSQQALFFSNDRANLKRKPHVLLSRKQKIKSETPLKQSVSMNFSNLATEKLKLVALQKELIECQLLQEKEKLQHNQSLQAMELEDAKKRYEHNELIRQLQLQSFNK